MLCYGMLSRYCLALALEELMQRQEVHRFLPGTHLQEKVPWHILGLQGGTSERRLHTVMHKIP